MRSRLRALGSAPACACVVLAAPPSAGAPARFEVAPSLGYARAFTTGLSPYGAYVGLGGRVRPAANVWLTAAVSSYVGSSVRGGVSPAYSARDRAYGFALSGSWRLESRTFSFEPGAEVGAAFVLGATTVGTSRVEDRNVAANVGPVVRIAARLGGVRLGLEGAALFVPSDAAAPVLRLGVLALVPL